MIWNKGLPKQAGRYRWRVAEGERIHVVTVAVKKADTNLKCSTMDVRKIFAGGEWSLVALQEAGSASLDELVQQI